MGWRDKGIGWRGGGEVGVIVLCGCARAKSRDGVEGQGNWLEGWGRGGGDSAVWVCLSEEQGWGGGTRELAGGVGERWG